MNVDFVFDVVNDDNKSSNVNTDINILYKDMKCCEDQIGSQTKVNVERQIMDEEMTIITFIRLR